MWDDLCRPKNWQKWLRHNGCSGSTLRKLLGQALFGSLFNLTVDFKSWLKKEGYYLHNLRTWERISLGYLHHSRIPSLDQFRVSYVYSLYYGLRTPERTLHLKKVALWAKHPPLSIRVQKIYFCLLGASKAGIIFSIS